MDLRICGSIRSRFYIEEDEFQTTASSLVNTAGQAICLLEETPDEEEYPDGFCVFVSFSDKEDITGQSIKLAESFNCTKYEVSRQALNCFNKEKGDNATIYFALEAALLIAAAIVAIAVLVIVRNAFNISAEERSRDYGILRCIGMTRKQVMRVILCEALITGTIGCIFGILLGHGFSWLGFRVLNSVAGEFTEFQIHIYGAAIWRTMLCILVVTSYAMISPIEKLYRLNPIESLNRKSEIRKKEDELKSGKRRKQREHKKQKEFKSIFGVEIAYAKRMIKRNPGRFWMSVAVLAAGCTVLVALGTGFEVIWQEFDQETKEQQWSGYFSADNYADIQKISSDTAEMDEVTEERACTSLYIYQPEHSEAEGISIIGVEDSVYEDMLAASKEKEKTDGKTAGNTVDVIGTSDTENYSFSNAGKTYTMHPSYVIDAESVRKILGLPEVHIGEKTYIYPLGDGFDVTVLNSPAEGYVFNNDCRLWIVLDETKSHDRFQSYTETCNAVYCDNMEQSRQILTMMHVIKSIAYILFGLLLVIFLTNSVNLTRAQMLIRKEEIGTLEVIGMSKKQKWKMFLAESLLSVIVALAIGFFIGNLIPFLVFFQLIISELTESTFIFRPSISTMAICAGLLFAVGILSVLLTAGKKETPAEKLR